MIPFIWHLSKGKIMVTDQLLPGTGSEGKELTTEEHDGSLGRNVTVLYHDCGSSYITAFAKSSNYIPKSDYVFYTSLIWLKGKKYVNISLGFWVFTIKLCFIFNNFHFNISKDMHLDEIHEGRILQILCPKFFFTWAPLCDLLRVSSTKGLLFLFLLVVGCIYECIYHLIT